MTTSTQNTTAFDLLRSVVACHGAREWVGDRTPQEAWEQCERGDRLLRIAVRAGVDHRLVVAAACACARLALVHVPAGEEWPRVAIETAEAWCRGEATTEQVRAAADAAYAYAAYAAYAADDAAAEAAAHAAAAAAYAAAYVASYVADAYAADAAYAAAHSDAAAGAGNATLRQCADLVRQMIPLDAVLARLAGLCGNADEAAPQARRGNKPTEQPIDSATSTAGRP